MIKIIAIIFISSLLLYSCSPVSSTARIGSTSKSKDIVANNSNLNNNNSELSNKNDNNSDTLTIKLPDVIAKSEPNDISSVNDNKAGSSKDNNSAISVRTALDNAIQLYEKGKIDAAEKSLISILASIDIKNSQYLEAKYYLSECNIAKNKLKVAKSDLVELYNSKTIDNSILERIILRLGQIECTYKNTKKAIEYFDELKSRFPESKLIELANCNFIKKK